MQGSKRHGALRALFAAAAFALLAPTATQAKDLIDAVQDQYGGNGILLATPAHSAHFQDSSQSAFASLAQGISSGINVSSSGSSTSSFTFDVQQAVFVRSTSSLGPTLAERAETIGEHKLNVAMTYTHASYTRFVGTSLDSMNFAFSHEPEAGNPGFTKDKILVNVDMSLFQDQTLLYSKFGITSNWDVGLIVPIVRTKMRENSLAVIQRNDPDQAESHLLHNFCLPGNVDPGTGGACAAPGPNGAPDVSTLNDPNRSTSFSEGDKTGIGDVVVRTKYNFLRDDPTLPDMAVLGGVRFNSGNANNFSGAGNIGFQGYFVASKTLGMFAPHLNLGAELTTDGGDTEIWRLIAGSEFTPAPWVTMSADVLGQQSFNGKGINDKLWNAGVGVKVNPFKTFALLGNVLMPLNADTGLRAQFTWSAGVEYTF